MEFFKLAPFLQQQTKAEISGGNIEAFRYDSS